MRKTRLPKREVEICSRLRLGRERIGLTQAECARQIGLERTTLLNYEHSRTPLRFEVALRFCRQFIISEEWLATGRFDAAHEKGRQQGVIPGSRKNKLTEEFDRKVLFRQCVDLLSEPATLHISPGTLFSLAYDNVLKPIYRQLVFQYFHYPRICLTDADGAELASNLLTAVNERFILLLSNEALRRGKLQSAAWRVYTRCLFECSDLVFKKMMGFKFPADEADHLLWLRNILADPDAIIPFIGEVPNVPKRSKAAQLALVS